MAGHARLRPLLLRGAGRLIAVVFLLAPPSAEASRFEDTAALCDRAAAAAARETGVPLRVLRAITRTETGRTRAGSFAPWPWTVNHAGDGHWFEDRNAALAFVAAARATGARNIDIGCFQINLRWHGEAFDGIAEMFDPAGNAAYAAQFLTELRDELGTWEAAVGAFHSRTPEFAERYLARYRRIHAALGEPGEAGPLDADPGAARTGPSPPRGLDLRPRPALLSQSGDGAGISALHRPARPLFEQGTP
jgi:hypothetical protein